MSDSISTRTLCAILDDMRDCYKTRNFSYLEGLIEEAQYRANRMEDAINSYGHDLVYLEQRRIDLKKEARELQEKVNKLKNEAGEDVNISRYGGL